MKNYINDEVKFDEVIEIWNNFTMCPHKKQRVLKKVARALLMDKQVYIVDNIRHEIALKHLGAGVYDAYLKETPEEDCFGETKPKTEEDARTERLIANARKWVVLLLPETAENNIKNYKIFLYKNYRKYFVFYRK